MKKMKKSKVDFTDKVFCFTGTMKTPRKSNYLNTLYWSSNDLGRWIRKV